MTGRGLLVMMCAMNGLVRPLSLATALAIVAYAGAASAGVGPGCDVSCPDKDGDGFVACSCAAREPCDCNDADPMIFPGAPEACDSPRDSNCNGALAESCGRLKGCANGMCLPECRDLDDFGCAPRSTLTRQPNGACLCVPDDCAVYGCGPGQTCDLVTRTCAPSCHPGVRCPFGQICRGFGCADPCEGITCERGSVCARGVCVASCDCPGTTACAGGLACDPGAGGRCVEPACVGVRCPAANHCVAGRCVDDCDGVECPPRLFCRHVASGDAIVARCVDLCAKVKCDPLSYCDYVTGTCATYPLPDAGSFVPVDSPYEDLTLLGAGVRCSATNGVAGAAAPIGLVVAAAIGLRWRRRRR